MPAKASPIKLLQLKLPTYSKGVMPERFETWLKTIAKLNPRKEASLFNRNKHQTCLD